MRFYRNILDFIRSYGSVFSRSGVRNPAVQSKEEDSGTLSDATWLKSGANVRPLEQMRYTIAPPALRLPTFEAISRPI
jgi:hypothetical protein